MRKLALMLVAGACALLLSSPASAAASKSNARPAAKRHRPAVQVVEMKPIGAHPQKPLAAVEISRRRLARTLHRQGPGLSSRIGRRLHQRPF